MGLLVTFLLGLFFILGSAIVKYAKNSKQLEEISISVALGTMSMLILFDIIPEIKEKNINIFLCIFIVLFGLVLLKVLDLFIPEHDHQKDDHTCSDKKLVHIGIVSLIAIVLHNIIEGMAVYSMTMTNLRSGLLTALGVGLHNIPMGMIIYTTLKSENKAKRIIAYLLSALSTFIGGLIMFFLGTTSDFVIGILLCLTLGMILYITIFELLPNVIHSENKKDSIIGILIGIIIVLLSMILE